MHWGFLPSDKYTTYQQSHLNTTHTEDKLTLCTVYLTGIIALPCKGQNYKCESGRPHWAIGHCWRESVEINHGESLLPERFPLLWQYKKPGQQSPLLCSKLAKSISDEWTAAYSLHWLDLYNLHITCKIRMFLSLNTDGNLMYGKAVFFHSSLSPRCHICSYDNKAGNESLLKWAVPIMGFLSIALMCHCSQCLIHTDL